jgi:putative transposase
VKYAFIKSQYPRHKISRMCDVFGVSSSGYYDWIERPESNHSKDDRRLVTKMSCFHKSSFEIYGSPRLHKDLVEDGEIVGVNRVARLMREAGIQSKMAKRFVITTDSRKTTEPAPDRLQRHFKVSRENEVGCLIPPLYGPERDGCIWP